MFFSDRHAGVHRTLLSIEPLLSRFGCLAQVGAFGGRADVNAFDVETAPPKLRIWAAKNVQFAVQYFNFFGFVLRLFGAQFALPLTKNV